MHQQGQILKPWRAVVPLPFQYWTHPFKPLSVVFSPQQMKGSFACQIQDPWTNCYLANISREDVRVFCQVLCNYLGLGRGYRWWQSLPFVGLHLRLSLFFLLRRERITAVWMGPYVRCTRGSLQKRCVKRIHQFIYDVLKSSVNIAPTENSNQYRESNINATSGYDENKWGTLTFQDFIYI